MADTDIDAFVKDLQAQEGAQAVQSLTHKQLQPNTAAPFLRDAAAFARGGLHDVLKQRGVPMPAWLDQGAAVFNNPDLNEALGITMGLKGMGPEDLRLVQQFLQLEQRGVPRDVAYRATGMYRGKDGKLRFEKSTKDVEVAAGTGVGITGPRSRIQAADIERSYPGLFTNMTHDLRLNPSLGPLDVEGSYWPTGHPTRSQLEVLARHPKELREITLHEMSHPIQEAEGFSRNEAPEDMLQAYLNSLARSMGTTADQITLSRAQFERLQQLVERKYWNQLGEVEARLAMKNADKTQAELLQTLPWEDYDVPESQVTVNPPARRRPPQGP
jgi:hypothetical protein